MWNNLILENILVFLLPFLEVVFIASMIFGIKMDKKVLKIISYVAITFMYFSICILLWANKDM